MEWLCSLKLKNIYLNGRFLQKFSQIFQSSFCNTFGRLLPWNKKPSRSSRPKVFLELAVLKYLRNYQETTHHEEHKHRVFLGTFLEFFWIAILKSSGDCVCGTENHNMTVSPDTLRSSRPEVFLQSSALKSSREFSDQGIFRTVFVTFGSTRPKV